MRLLKDYFFCSLYLSQILALGGAVDGQLVYGKIIVLFFRTQAAPDVCRVTFSLSQVVSINTHGFIYNLWPLSVNLLIWKRLRWQNGLVSCNNRFEWNQAVSFHLFSLSKGAECEKSRCWCPDSTWHLPVSGAEESEHRGPYLCTGHRA